MNFPSLCVVVALTSVASLPTEDEILSVPREALAACAKEDIACLKTPEVQASLTWLSENGTSASFPILWQLEHRFVWDAVNVRTHILERSMREAIQHHPCHPPSYSEIAKKKQTLKDFVVVRSNDSKPFLEMPSEHELEDLAYFFSAMEEDEVVGAAEHKRSASPSVHAQREKLVIEIEKAKELGHLQDLAKAARVYLKTLGFPGAIRAEEESEYGWHGGRFYEIMMELALVDEALGNNDEAALLYRTANPGNSICGTGERERLNSQIQGAIRSEERRGRCRSVVAEYLLFPGDENFPGDAKANASYHVSRLSQAGFDVNRLYRGAWVTANRSSDEKAFRALIEAAPPSLREKAKSRLLRKGPEAWAERLSQGRFDDKFARLFTSWSLSEIIEKATKKKDSKSPDTQMQHALGSIAMLGKFDTGFCERRGLVDQPQPSNPCLPYYSISEIEEISKRLLPFLQNESPQIRAQVEKTLETLRSSRQPIGSPQKP